MTNCDNCPCSLYNTGFLQFLLKLRQMTNCVIIVQVPGLYWFPTIPTKVWTGLQMTNCEMIVHVPSLYWFPTIPTTV